MATVRTASTLALELDAQPAGPLRSCQPASLRVEAAASSGLGPATVLHPGVRVTLGEMAAEADLAAPGPLLDWLQRSLDGSQASRSGAVVLADANLVPRRRIAFERAWLSALTWPVLDAAVARMPFTLGLRWLAERVDDQPASGKARPVAASKRKAMLTSNFRVQGLPFGGAAVQRVQLPDFRRLPPDDKPAILRDPRPQAGTVQLGELVLAIGARDAGAARQWAQARVADGRVDLAEGLALQVELLDASLKNLLATISLDRCLLRGLDEDPLGGSERLSGLTLRFAVAGLGLKLVA